MMSEAAVVRKAVPQAQSTASGHTQMTSRQPYITETAASKRVCFYKSGDAQFSGLPVIINSRTFKTFEALLDSLSKRVPLPFGVRTITTPRGHTAVRSLDQLHHGHSYICSDRRTVKPIDLERARRKPPPWYHARPVSARRLAWYTHSPAQHGTYSARRNERVLLHTPKRLELFRNGEPEVKHTLTLQRRTTYSFEALLDHMSEVMRFPVLKLYTPEGRRVDGLPALILCSGVLVAAGREPFKKSNYDVQKSSPPIWPPAKRQGRQHPITRKKKSRTSKSYPFSLSSERYFVNQIQNSLPESVCDCPSNPNGSVEAVPGHHLESVSETEIITSLDGEREDDTHMPSDDDIEKSFRVNQDGSMTVEMKVRLTIKEEETIHWTTTVSRSSVSNQFMAVTAPCPDLDANFPPQNDTAAIEVIESDLNDRKEGCEVNQQGEINGASMELEPLPSPLAHLHKVQYKQGSIESIMTVSDTEIHEISSFSYMEDLDNGEVKQEDRMAQHCNRPVPKPRCALPSDMNTTTWLQFQDNQKKTCETLLHIYEMQTCQENFSGNTQCGYIASSDTVPSDKTFHSFNEDMKSEASATIKCQSNGKQDILSPISTPYASTYKTSTTSTQRAKMLATPGTTFPKASGSKGALTVDTSAKRKPVRVIVKKNYLFKSANPERKQRDKKDDILKEIKKIRADILSQKGAMKHFRAKAGQKLLKRRNNSGNKQKAQTERVQLKRDDRSLLLVETEQTHVQGQADFTLPKENVHKASLSKSTLTEYVELWLQKSEPQLSPVHSCLETIPKNNTMAKASLFNYQPSNTIQPSTKDMFDEKGIHLYSPNTKKPVLLDKEQSGAKTRGNQQISELISKTCSYDTERIHTKPLTEPMDLQSQKFYTVKMAVRPDMKPILDYLCYSIQSLREITQHKRSLYLKTSKCLPDFSSYLASTFGSSCRVLLAFLSVMTLKDGLSHLNTCCHTETNLSSEAMLMLQSLNELAVIEDAEHLRISLSDLYNSASVQLLQNWKGFQVLSKKESISATNGSESHHRTNSEEEEHSIQVLLEYLGVPDRVREELAALDHVDLEYMTCNQMEDTDKVSDSLPDMKMNGCSELHSKEQMAIFSDFVLKDYVNIYVNSVIDQAINAHLKDRDNLQVFTGGSLARPEMGNLVIADRCQKDLRNENFYNIKRTFQGDAISDSDICEDMAASESSFGAEMWREMGLKRTELQGLEKARPVRQEAETVKKHQEKEEEMREESNEEIGTWEENSSELDETLLKKEEVIGKEVNEIVKDIDTVEDEGTELSEESLVICTGELNLSVNEKVYCDESFPEDRPFNEEKNLSVKMSGPEDVVEQICSKEKISGPWENKIQTIQTLDQFQNETMRTERDGALPEVRGISHFVHVESDIEVDEMKHQDLCMESRTYSEEEHVILETPECYTVYQENFEEMSEEATEYEENEIDFKGEKASAVANLISSLQDQEKSASKRPYNTAQTFGEQLLNHINEPNLEAAVMTKTTERASVDSVSSSLAFSYDSKNRDSEVHIQTNRVKSIRDMFLAKNNKDILTQPSRPSSDLSDDRESSDRNEHQSSISSEASREEKDECRLAIAKGYVKRTIERLYGQGSKGSSSGEKRSSSAHKVKKREGLRSTNAPRLPSINEAHKNATPDLSYFNATSSGDAFNEPVHCVTLNARLGPKDAVLIDKGRWLCRENQTSPKSCPENEDTPKHVKEKESEKDSGKEDIPYSLFGHSPMIPDKDLSFTEQGENTGCLGKTFTYFHLPNASDSEVQPDEQKTDIPKGNTENKDTPLAETPKCWAEKQSIVTVFSPPSNKVHPMVETTPPVVKQPTKGQSTEVTRRSAEPDALEILYMFCGQHCPIL